MARQVRDTMRSDPVSVQPDTPIQQVAALMDEHEIGDVLVTEGEKLVGIITDRDIVVRAIAHGKAARDTPAKEVCSNGGDLATVGPDDDLGEALRLMREKAVRRIPVVENGKPVGIVSLGDVALEGRGLEALRDISAASPDE